MYKIQQERITTENVPKHHTHIGGVLPIAPMSNCATRIAGKRKSRASVRKIPKNEERKMTMKENRNEW